MPASPAWDRWLIEQANDDRQQQRHLPIKSALSFVTAKIMDNAMHVTHARRRIAFTSSV